ncbi:MAG: NAD(P)-dependent oxidoreductase [Thermodesulfobacteriota bacterium]|nr:MAG: NAD(P)-dependent oxidoreductase [Thermodesulfobacteriota bacterium]
MKVLVTGATGYIGGRLITDLLDKGVNVRVLVRDPSRIEGRLWKDNVEVFVGDLLNPDSLKAALKDIDVAYYLVHSMYGGKDYAEKDRQAANNFVNAGQHLKKVIYLGGLLPNTEKVSTHLKSRSEVGEILRKGLPTLEFRAGPIIGSGSASFEMVRYLTERLPVMVAPKWIHHQVQPIAVRDVMRYLVLALDKEYKGVLDIGADVLTFKQMMDGYAKVRGFTRTIITVPVLAPKLAAIWVGLVTPISNSLAVPLIEGVIHPIVGHTSKALEAFPEIRPLPYVDSVERALNHVNKGDIETRWSGALGSESTYSVSEWRGLVTERRSIHIDDIKPETVFNSFTSLGGEKGWLVWEWAWEIRGLIDRLMGGPGLRRGRRHPVQLLPGEALDFWRVEEVERPEILRLRAEMKVPGRAWLEWQAMPEGNGTRLVQTALFEPSGLWGVLYWRCLYPIHRFIFDDMISAIAEDSKNMNSAKSNLNAIIQDKI